MNKQKLLDLIRTGEADLDVFSKQLTPEERETNGSLAHWSAKDLVGHLAAWQRRLVEWLKIISKGEAAPEFEENDHLDHHAFLKNQGQPWKITLTEVTLTSALLTRMVQSLNEDTLNDTQLYPGAQGRPLWRRILSNSYMHWNEHLVQWYVDHNKLDQAVSLMEKTSDLLILAEENSIWQSAIYFNLSCFYARTSLPERAYTALRSAFNTNPKLKEWAKKDSDLAPLFTDPRFLDLFFGS
jgi:hypothetical protein